MLYHIAFYDAIHRPYILESYILLILLLSIIPPFIHIPLVLLHNLEFHFFFTEKIAVATTI